MLALSVGTASLTSCYDDNNISPLWAVVSDHEQRLSDLEEWQDQVNQNIESLQRLLNTTDYITAVTPLMEGGQEVGYTITFLNSDPINIYHGAQGDEGDKGEPGEQGDDGHTPQIGLTQATSASVVTPPPPRPRNGLRLGYAFEGGQTKNRRGLHGRTRSQLTVSVKSAQSAPQSMHSAVMASPGSGFPVISC